MIDTKQHHAQNLHFPFYENYPKVFLSKLRWKLNDWKNSKLYILNYLCQRLTIKNLFNGIGDTLLLTVVIHELKRRYPNIKLNIITAYPELLDNLNGIFSINSPETYWSVDFAYFKIRNDKLHDENLLNEFFKKIYIRGYDYSPSLVLSEKEKKDADQYLKGIKKPFITINTNSKEQTKNWPSENWQLVVNELKQHYTFIQLGDQNEPYLRNVIRWAGKLSLRESCAILDKASFHLGIVSFLMHVSHALNTKSIIIYGGRETPKNSGYEKNINIINPIECSPCWIHTTEGEICPYNNKCLKEIAPETVLSKVKSLIYS